jgi:hypothetical protein
MSGAVVQTRGNAGRENSSIFEREKRGIVKIDRRFAATNHFLLQYTKIDWNARTLSLVTSMVLS